MKYAVRWVNPEGKKFEEWFGTHDGAVKFCKELHTMCKQFKKAPGIHRLDWEYKSKRSKDDDWPMDRSCDD